MLQESAKPAGKELVLWYIDGVAYCSDAKSTAYEFPLMDGKVTRGEDGHPIVEVPFDGTRYDLTDGRVVEWCPKNNPLRVVLGSLKSKGQAKPLPVHECVLTRDDELYVKLTRLG